MNAPFMSSTPRVDAPTAPAWHSRAVRLVVAVYTLCGLLSAAAVLQIGMGVDAAFEVSGIAVLATLAVLLGSMVYSVSLLFVPRHRHIVLRGQTLMPLFGLHGFGMVGVMFLAAMHARISAEKHMVFQPLPDVLRIDGAIASSLPDKIAELPTDYHPSRVMLGFNSGGLVHGMLDAARLLHERRIDTVVIDGLCASSCAYLALTFPHRLIAKGGRLGFHDVRGVGNDREAAWHVRRQLTEALVSSGYRSDLVGQLLSSDEIVWYSRAESLQKNLATGCWDVESARAVTCPE